MVGIRQIFVRFLGCDLACKYCDTPNAAGKEAGTIGSGPSLCRVQKPASRDYEDVPNPIGTEELTRYCSRLVPASQLSRPVISITGGEPLLQEAFLSEWLLRVHRDFSIYLETSGIHYEALAKIRDLIDVVSMDFKLPSATEQRPFWKEHKKFLTVAKGRNVFVKIVVTNNTSREDIIAAASIVAGSKIDTILIIQPASGRVAPGPGQLIEFQDIALGIIPDVRVIPQVHKLLELP